MNGNVMWMSDSFNAPSGFGQQTFHAVSRLTSGPNAIHIDNVGWQWSGNPALLNDNWRVLPTGGKFASAILPHHLKIYKPDVLITLADLWNVQYVLNMRRAHPFKWMEWLPIDGKPLSDVKWISAYNSIDVIVAMSDFGYNELKTGKKEWMDRLERDEPPTVLEKIYHGVPTDILKPYNEEERLLLRRNYDWQDEFIHDTKLRKDFVKGKQKFEDYFVFGIVARNQPRKNYPWLLQAWADFAEMHDNVLLWVHASPSDPAGMNLHFVADQLGCADSVIFSDSVSQWYGKSSKEMADIFNLFDVHFLPTAGEGFGIPTVESMACGVYTAVTDFTTGTELINKGEAGHLMKCDRVTIDPGLVLRVKYLREEILHYLEEVYNTPEATRRQRSRKGRERAVKVYSAENMAAKWRNLIDKHITDVPTKRVHTNDLQLHYGDGYMQMREIDAQAEYAKNEYRLIGKYLEKGDDVLEAGCGSGEGMIFLSRHFEVSCRGVDVSEASIKRCRQKGLYVQEHDCNDRLPFDNDSFDVVFSQHVVEHLKEDVAPILDSLRVARRCAVHVVPHDNMIDPEHRRPYVLEDVERLEKEVKRGWDLFSKSDLKTTIHKNYVHDANKPQNLVSYVMVFEKV